MHPTKRYSRDEPRQIVGTLAGQGGRSFSMQGAAAAMAAARAGVHPPNTTSHHQHVAQFRAAQMMAAAQQTSNVAVGIAAARAAGIDQALTAAGRQDLMPFLAPRPSPACSQNMTMKPSKTNVQLLSQSSSPVTLTNNQPVPIAPADSKKQRKAQGAPVDASHGVAAPSGANNTKESKPLEIPPLGAPLPSMTDMLMLDIPTPFIHPHDVLCGRGGGTNNHSGNEKFRALVNSKKVEYLHSIKREKPRVSRGIVRAVRNQHPPGRFLQKDEKTGLWYDIGDQKAQEKTSQALRERAPELRREITNTLGVDTTGQGFPHSLTGPLSYRNLSLAATRAAIASQAESNGLDVPPENSAQKVVLSGGAPGFAMHAAQAAATQQAIAAQQVAAVATQQAVAAQRAAQQQVPSRGMDQYEQLRLQAAARVKHTFAMQHHQKQAAMRQQAQQAAAIAAAQVAPGNAPSSSMLRPLVQSQQAMQSMRLSHQHSTNRPISSSLTQMPQSDPMRLGRTDNASGMPKGLDLPKALRLGLSSSGGVKNSYSLPSKADTGSEMYASRSMSTNDLVMNKLNVDPNKTLTSGYHSMKGAMLERTNESLALNGKKRDRSPGISSVCSLPFDCIRRLDLAETMAQRTVNGTITEQQKDEEYRISLYMDAGLLGISPSQLVQALSNGKTESDLVEESYSKHGKKRKLDGLLPPLRKAPKMAGALEGLGALTKIGIQNALSVIGAKI